MPVVGCPKCKKKFQLPNEMVGKAIRCSNCKTAFKVAAGASPAKASKPSAKAAPPSRSKAPAKGGATATKGGPPKRPAPNRRGPDPLGNFHLEDPGFAPAGATEKPAEEFNTTTESRKHLLANPALKAASAAKGKGKKSSVKGGKKSKPDGFIPIKIFGYIIIAIGAIAIAASIFLLAMFVTKRMNPDFEVSKSAVTYAIFGGWGCVAFTFVASLVYWPLAHTNTSALGAKGQSFSPLWMVLGWLIPLLNFVWPMQGVTETLKASKRPVGEKWKNTKVIVWEAVVWPIAAIAYPALMFLSYEYRNGFRPTHESLYLWMAALAVGAIAMLAFVSPIFRVTQAQYKHLR